MHGNKDGETGVDEDMAAEGMVGIGAWILGRKRAALIDELPLAIRPVLLGAGEALWTGLDLPALGYESVKHVAGVRATHVSLRRRA